MAKAKKKNGIQITSVKSDNTVLKKGVKATVVSKKPQAEKKEEKTNNEVKKQVKKVAVKKTNSKNTNNKKKSTKVSKPVVKKELPVNENKPLTQEEIIAQRKERNRKKYEKGQKKYREKKDNKKIPVEVVPKEEKIEVKEIEKETKKPEIDLSLEDTDLIKKVRIETDEVEKTKVDQKNKRKEKRQTNRKTSGFTQTLINIKELSVNKINDVKEVTSDNKIPIGKTYDEQTKRSRRLIKEAIVYAVILTLINVLCIVFIDYFNFLRLFDVKWLNVVVTILISLIFNFFVAFMVDYFVTNVWLVKRRKKKDGEQNGDNWTL